MNRPRCSNAFRALTIDGLQAKQTCLVPRAAGIPGLIVAAAENLQSQGIGVRCVSMPSWELFEELSQTDRDAVLPPSVSSRLAVELGVSQGWDRYIGANGGMISVERFGASAPAEVLLREYGFTVDNVCARARELLSSKLDTTNAAQTK